MRVITNKQKVDQSICAHSRYGNIPFYARKWKVLCHADCRNAICWITFLEAVWKILECSSPRKILLEFLKAISEAGSFSSVLIPILLPEYFITQRCKMSKLLQTTCSHLCSYLYIHEFHCTALHCTAQHWTELNYTAVHCTALQCNECNALHGTRLD